MNQAEQEKSQAALKSVFAAFFLTGMKLAVGLFSGSLGVLAEAAHSGLDLIAALLTFFAVRVASKPADKEHPYGHGKVENLSALAETVLLLATCAWILHEAWERLVARDARVDASLWTFLVVATLIGIDLSRSRFLMAAARKHNSHALEADALHFRTDVWSSAVVLAGLMGVKLGDWFPALRFMSNADALAAVVVAAIVAFVCAKMGYKTVSELLDTAPSEMTEQIKHIVEAVDNVKNCHAIRVRSAGAEIFIDAHVVLEGTLSLKEAHRIIDNVEAAVHQTIPRADITVHAEPPEEPEP